MPRAKRGFTLIEILVATAVAVLIMGAISSVFYYLLVIPPQQTDQLNAENQLRLSLDWIQRDGVQAHSFNSTDEYPCSLSEGYYGYFSSYANASCAEPGCSEILVAYRYDGVNKRLVREESREEAAGCEPDPPKTTTIAYNIADVDDVRFYCGDNVFLCDGRNPITVNMTVTRNKDSQNKVRKEISITDTRKIEMRAAP